MIKGQEYGTHRGSRGIIQERGRVDRVWNIQHMILQNHTVVLDTNLSQVTKGRQREKGKSINQ